MTAIDVLKKMDDERLNKIKNWEKDKSDVLKRLQQDLKNFEQRESERVLQETGKVGRPSLGYGQRTSQSLYHGHPSFAPVRLKKRWNLSPTPLQSAFNGGCSSYVPGSLPRISLVERAAAEGLGFYEKCRGQRGFIGRLKR